MTRKNFRRQKILHFPVETIVQAFTEDTIYCWSEVLEKIDLNVRNIAAIRLRSVGTKEKNHSMKVKSDDGRYLPTTVLDFDYWVLVPREL